MKILAARLTVAVLISVSLMLGQSESPVVGVGPFLHIISDLDQSIAFYHDVLGLELTGPAGADHKFTDNPAVANLYGVPGKQFRAAVLKIPGSQMGIELVQWGDLGGPKPLDDEGYAMLLLFRPNAVPDRAILQDPDGLPVAVGRADLALHLAVTAGNIPKTIALYEKVLGFKADGNWLSVPGAALRIHLGDTRASDVYPQPSRAMLRLHVRDIDALTVSLKNAGCSVITTGGAPVTLPQGPRVIILRDPNNFYLQLMEAR